MFTEAVLIIIALAATGVSLVALRQWRGDKYLCDDCQFNDPESCHKAERPRAVECFAYKK